MSILYQITDISGLKLLPRWTRYLGLILVLPCLVMFFYKPDVVFGEMSFLGTTENKFESIVFALFDQSSGSESGDFVFYSWVKNDIINENFAQLDVIWCLFYCIC